MSLDVESREIPAVKTCYFRAQQHSQCHTALQKMTNADAERCLRSNDPVIKSTAILTHAWHLDNAPQAVRKPGGQPRSAAASTSCRWGLPAGTAPRAQGPAPGFAWRPPAQGFLPGFHPDLLLAPEHTANPTARPPASTARALRAQALRAAPAPYRAGSGGRPSPPPAPAGPRSPLSPPASASSSARALGAAATSPEVRPVAGGRCDPAECGRRGAGAPRTGSVGSGNPAALV